MLLLLSQSISANRLCSSAWRFAISAWRIASKRAVSAACRFLPRNAAASEGQNRGHGHAANQPLPRLAYQRLAPGLARSLRLKPLLLSLEPQPFFSVSLGFLLSAFPLILHSLIESFSFSLAFLFLGESQSVSIIFNLPGLLRHALDVTSTATCPEPCPKSSLPSVPAHGRRQGGLRASLPSAQPKFLEARLPKH